MSSEKKFLPSLYPKSKEVSKTWFVLYTTQDGKRRKVYGRLNDLPLQDRENEARRIIADIINTQHLKTASTPQNQLVKDLQEAYDLRLQDWRPKTISAYQTHLFMFIRWYREQGCPTMTTLEAVRFLNSISGGRAKGSTRNNYMKNLRSLFKDLTVFHRHRYTYNPFADIRKSPEPERTKEWLRPGQLLQVANAINEADPELYMASTIMYHCFPRPSELRQLCVRDINFDTKKLRIEGSVAKTKRIRYVNIPDELLHQLQAVKEFPQHYYLFSKDGGPGTVPLSRDSLSKRHKEILVSLQLPPGYTFYSWKNTGAVKMLMHDRKPMRYISKCMGHHSLDMTDRYFGSLGVDEMAESIIFPQLPVVGPWYK